MESMLKVINIVLLTRRKSITNNAGAAAQLICDPNDTP